MVATAANCAFLAITPTIKSSHSASKSSLLDTRGAIKAKASCSGRLQVKASAQEPRKMNGSAVGLTTAGGVKGGAISPTSPPPRTFIKQLPDWSMLLASITTVFKRQEKLMDPFALGRIVQDGFVFRQNFSIRSYEIGADKTASMETLMNHLQETAINHVKAAGILGHGFGSTPAMCKKNLIWVLARLQVIVDRYPVWEDVVQVDTWVNASGKNGLRRDWRIRDCKTGETLIRASSVYVIMNKDTRKLSKMPDEVRDEISPHFIDTPVIEDDGRKLTKLDDNTAEYILGGLTPRWSDLDVNEHVNNVKYIGWALESVPLSLLESHELSGITLEYRRECGKNSTLQSLTTINGAHIGGLQDSGHVESEHLVRFDDGAEVLRARTEWRPKHAKIFGQLSQLQAEGA